MRPLSVAIVGMGPRGLSVLERLLVQLARRPAGRPVVIWAVEPVEHGPGRVWRTDQPGWLTMNATAGEVTIRSPDDPLLSAAAAASSLAHWQPGLRSADYPERRDYGRYLRAIFDELRARAPEGVDVRPVSGTATALERADGGRWLVIDHGRRRLPVEKVVLATGHADLDLSDEERALAAHADGHGGLLYVAPGLTTQMPLERIAPGSAVAVRGLGLTFYDVVRSLTLGRGGRFDRSRGGTLRYVPSGDEPRMHAGSRGGLPFLSRARISQPPETAPRPVALTEHFIAEMRSAAMAARGSPQLEFAREVERLLQVEADHAYYRCAAGLRGGPCAARRFADADRRLIEDGGANRAADRAELLSEHGLGDLPGADLQALARPFDGSSFRSPAVFRRRLAGVLAADVAESRMGTTASPVKAALEALRALRPALPSVVDFGGLTPDSHRDFLSRWAPRSFVLSAGPEAEQVEQLAALLSAGVLEVVGPAARFTADRGRRCFAVESPAVAGSRREAATLVDARVPTTDLRRDRSPLMRRLLADGAVSEHVNTGRGDEAPFPTGGLAVTRAPSRVVDAAGGIDPDLYAIGVATEHTRWFTQVGTGRPGRDSPFLREADAIALDMVRAGRW